MGENLKNLDQLRSLTSELSNLSSRKDEQPFAKPLELLEQAANQVGKAWSGSWIGYQSRVYHNDLTPPPPGEHFSSEWGLDNAIGMGTRGDWVEYDLDAVVSAIYTRANNPDLLPIRSIASQIQLAFDRLKDQLIATLAAHSRSNADFFGGLITEAEKVRVLGLNEAIRAFMPKGSLMSRDSLAMSQGLQAPPHIRVMAEITSLRSPSLACSKLSRIASRATTFLEHSTVNLNSSKVQGSKLFIGHGRSSAWLELRDFLRDRLTLEWDEYNRVPVAGGSRKERLQEMLEDSAFAFLVMTGEDISAEGVVQARMNVVHEVGLFQGRLGFRKAIVLLEEGCEEFSNIHGVDQLRFPKGQISTLFEEIRRVLEREGLLNGPATNKF